MPANVPPEADASLAQMWRQVWQKTRAICQEEIRKVLGANYVGGKLDGGAIGGTVPPTALPLATTTAAGIVLVDHNASPVLTEADLGAANGVAELDSSGNVPLAELGNIPVGSSSTFGVVKADGSTITASGGVLSAIGGGSLSVTTKGDLQGYSTAAARIPVGSNGQVLTADSTQALGVKWAAAGSGHPFQPLVTPPVLSNWTQTNAGSATFSDVTGGVSILTVAEAANMRMLTRAATGPYTLVAGLILGVMGTGGSPGCGLMIRDSATGHMIRLGIYISALVYLQVATYSGPSTGVANLYYNNVITSGLAWYAQPLWFKIVNNGSTRVYFIGFNGHDWVQLYSEAVGTYITENQAGFYADSGGSGYPNCATCVSWSGV